jgi:hypothetical protein
VTKILSRVLFALSFSLALFALQSLSAQDLGVGGPTKENLDLPFDAAGESEEEEDAPEIVTFYGQQLEGDGVFYVVDKSGSMRDQGELAIAQREVIRNVQEFSDRVQFGIVFFDSNVVKFPASGMPAEANPGMKAAAVSFVLSVVGVPGSCCQKGLAEALRMANLATPKRKVIVYVGDGGGHCNMDQVQYHQQTLAAITGQNYQRIPINCIAVLNPEPIQIEFLKKLSGNNGGTYTRIVR